MQTHSGVCYFIGDESFDFHHVRLKCSLCMKTTWHLDKCWIKVRERAHVDLVDFGAPYPDHTHVMHAWQLISSVKSNGYHLISQSATRGVTCSCLRMLR